MVLSSKGSYRHGKSNPYESSSLIYSVCIEETQLLHMVKCCIVNCTLHDMREQMSLVSAHQASMFELSFTIFDVLYVH